QRTLEQVLPRLPLARRTVRREMQRPGSIAHAAEAATHHEATEPADAEPDGHHHAAQVHALPEREAIAAKQPGCRESGGDEPAVERQTSTPDLRPRPAIGLLRPTHRRLRVPQAG